MDAQFLQKVEKQFVSRDPDIRPGDTVRVHLRITEAGKERIQVYEGMVISVRGTGMRKTITVRKISYGVGVEKIFPVNSPIIKKIDITKRGNVRRSKLYYLRNKIGKRSLDVNTAEGFEAIMEEEAATAQAEGDEKPGTETATEAVAEDAREQVAEDVSTGGDDGKTDEGAKEGGETEVNDAKETSKKPAKAKDGVNTDVSDDDQDDSAKEKTSRSTSDK